MVSCLSAEKQGYDDVMKHFRIHSLETLKEFRKNWMFYLLLAVLPGLIVRFFAMPFFNWWADRVIAGAGIPYLSYNTVTLLLENPLTCLELLVELFVMIATAFLELSVLLCGIRLIRENDFSFTEMMKEAFHALIASGWKSFGWVAVYLLVVLPFGSLIYHNDVFSKIVIPQFIVDWILNRPLLAGGLILFYVLMGLAALKRIYTLPLMILHDMSYGKASAESRKIMKGQLWQSGLGLLAAGILCYLFADVFSYGICVLQDLLDTLPHMAALSGAVCNMTILILFNVFFGAFLVIFLILYALPAEMCIRMDRVVSVRQAVRIRKPLKILALLGICGLIFLSAIASWGYLNRYTDRVPLVISHRGVNGNNGVQNTIHALLSTNKEAHPERSTSVLYRSGSAGNQGSSVCCDA
jgi:glycerophosphoryl diester phosphodiesterase